MAITGLYFLIPLSHWVEGRRFSRALGKELSYCVNKFNIKQMRN